MTDLRLQQASQWVRDQLSGECQIEPLAGDASFRRYFRVRDESNQYVLMDAPPEQEDVQPFLDVRDWLESIDVRVPRLIAESSYEGFLLLEDFGDMTWSAYIHTSPEKNTRSALFEDALRQLNAIQQFPPSMALPRFGMERMQQECDLYLDWYLPRVARVSPSDEERAAFHKALVPALNELTELPATPVHLDYHSRNLMLPEQGLPLGVIDFQDAVMGPCTYDLASLLYDCYQNYPESEREGWSYHFFEMMEPSRQAYFPDAETWHRALRLTAMQRHIKAIGIFARLSHRDGKKQFLDEIPLTRLHLAEEMQALGLDNPEFELLKIEPAVDSTFHLKGSSL